MTMKSRILPIAAGMLIAAAGAFAQAVPNFTQYVSLGDSLTAGWESGCLVDRHQLKSYPAWIAAGSGHTVAAPGDTDPTHFQQPLVAEPGLPQPCWTASFDPTTFQVVIDQHAGEPAGGPENATLGQPYNNLGIPGAHSYDLVNVTTSPGPTDPSANLYTLILRNFDGSPLAGFNAVEQAVGLHPTFVTVWIGNNDVLDAAASATVISPSCGVVNGDPGGHCDGFVAPNGTFVPLTLTPVDYFTTSYTQILGTLAVGAPGATVLVANIPDVDAIPFTTTIPPVVVNPATLQPILDPSGNVIPLIGEHHDGSVGPIDPTNTLVTLGAAPLEELGFGIPCAIFQGQNAPPFCDFPLPDGGLVAPGAQCNGAGLPQGGLCPGVLLYADEVDYITQRIHDVNVAIGSAAAAVGAKVLDVHTLFNDIKANGRTYAGVHVTTDYLTGGIFSYDGVHPSNAGYAIVADEMIQFINSTYGVHLARPNVYEALFQPDTPPGSGSQARRDSVEVGLCGPYHFSFRSWQSVLDSFAAGPGLPTARVDGAPLFNPQRTSGIYQPPDGR